MGDSSRGFGGPNPIDGPSGADQEQHLYPPPPPAPATAAPPAWSGPALHAPWGRDGAPPQYPTGQPHLAAPYGETPGGQQPFPPPPWGPPGYGLPPVPARRPNRTPLYLGLGAAGLVIALIIGAVVIVSGNSGGGADTPSEAVQKYFQALADGDADAALALGQSQPPNTTFLTDDILKKQTAEMPITNIKTLGETPGHNGAVMVQVSVDFGGSTTSDKIPVREVDGGWKVPHAALKLDMGRNSNLYKPELFDFVTVFGEPAPKSGVAYVFPGPVEFGSSNPNIAISSRDIGTPGMMNIFLGLSSQNVEFDVAEEGTSAILEAIMAKVTDCAKSTQLMPPDCPIGTQLSGLIDGTAEWTVPHNFDTFSADFLHPQTGKVQFNGSIDLGLRVQTDRGRLYETTIQEFLTGEADVLTNPPTITYGP